MSSMVATPGSEVIEPVIPPVIEPVIEPVTAGQR